jgi:hypothetical protein
MENRNLKMENRKRGFHHRDSRGAAEDTEKCGNVKKPA